ncbi:hypothetical protein PWT90_10357 [Aphanocladium album]|nr:hypothetical protein PWT90_10357 [Aphanocladium album]
MIVGILMFIAFAFIETKAAQPLVPFGVLNIDSLFTLVCIAAGWSSFVYICGIHLEPGAAQRRNTSSRLGQFIPVAISGLFAAIGTGIALSQLRLSSAMLLSMIAFALGGVILATMPIRQTYWAQEFDGTVIMPWGMEMSFPAAPIVLSRAMPRKHQSLAASLVNAFVNYSISIGLGFAGTVDSNTNDGGRDIIQGFRGTLYTGVGLAGLVVVVALLFYCVECYRPRSAESVAPEGEKQSVNV